MKLPSPRAGALLLSASSALLNPAWAGNGLNVIGIGAQSLAMGSADVAVPGSTTAVVLNPANLSQIPGSRFDASIEPFVTYGYHHSDDLNVYQTTDQPYGALLNSSYSTQLFQPDLSFSIGMFVAGGAGSEYEDMTTVFGTTDEYSAIFGVTKLATGIGWQVTPTVLIATEVTWLNWNGSANNVTLSARSPGNSDPAVPATVQLVQALDFRDQFVFALGMAYDTSPKTRVMVGINLARNPIPNQSVTPTINLTQELELNAGFRRTLSKHWEISSAVQFQPGKSEAANNPAQPFTNARDGYGVFAVLVEVSRRW